jgi:predicted nucleic acid-binding protein
MSTPPPYGGRQLIADSSAWTALQRARKIGNVPPDWARAIEADQLRSSPVVEIELLHSARNAAEFEEWRLMLSILRPVPLTNPACNAAIHALWELSQKSDGYHRVGLGDALIAASAQDAAVGVLHYNPKDFEKLAEVLNFESVPIGAPGEFELPEKGC